MANRLADCRWTFDTAMNRWHLPAADAQPVRDVEQRVSGLRAVLDLPGDGRDAAARISASDEFERPELSDFLREVLRRLVAGHMDIAVTLAPESHEIVILGDDLSGGPREVDGEGGHLAAEIVHVEDETSGEEPPTVAVAIEAPHGPVVDHGHRAQHDRTGHRNVSERAVRA